MLAAMAHRYAILGAGRQGVAAAYDLARLGEADHIHLLDLDRDRAIQAGQRLRNLIERVQFSPSGVDVGNPEETKAALKEVDVALSAVPFHMNEEVARAALRAKTHLCDLGGSTEIVLRQLELDEEARRSGVTIVPDCGLAPGTANALAAYAIARVEQMDAQADSVKIYGGGLPQNPLPPLNYQLLFSIEGLLKEYTATVHVLRDGAVRQLQPLTELETLELPEPVGQAEAFLTSGGSSTGPWTYERKLQTYEYKTIRYPGHCDMMRAIRDLGLLSTEPVLLGDARLSPRDLFRAVAGPRLEHPDEPDLVVLRVCCHGRTRTGDPLKVRYELLDFLDASTGLTAMERATGFSAALVMSLLARGEAKPGVATPERAIPPDVYVRGLLHRGFKIVETIQGPRSRP